MFRVATPSLFIVCNIWLSVFRDAKMTTARLDRRVHSNENADAESQSRPLKKQSETKTETQLARRSFAPCAGSAHHKKGSELDAD